MARTDRAPGRRRAVPPPRRRRFARPSFKAKLVDTLWLLLVALGALALISGWTPLDLPGWVPTSGAVTITTLYACGLVYRAGGRAAMSGALALVLTVVSVLSQIPVLLVAAAVSTAVLAGLLAVMSTTPAAGFPAVIRECTVATLVAVVGAFAVEAYQAEVSLERVGYLTFGLSLLGGIVLGYRLGAGLHGLGTRGSIMVVSGLGLLLVTLAYTEALSRWGAPGLTNGIDEVVRTIRDAVGAVPRPVEVLVGFPALAWGVSTRARRRQGWWVCVFGAAGLSLVAVSLLDAQVSLLESGQTLLYSAVLGLLLGYLVIRADQFLTGARSRGARRREEAAAHRPEPGRMQPLL